MHSLGALPPKGMEWQTGKTAASIKFVNDVTQQMYRGLPFGQYDEVKYTKMQKLVDAVKGGEKVITEFVDVLELFKSL